MNILWLSHFVPYPPKGGCFQRSYNLLKEVARKNEVYLVALKHKESSHPESEVERAKEELEKFCKKVFIIELTSFSGPNLPLLAFKSLFTRDPLTVNLFKSKKMRSVIRELVQDVKMDIAHYDTISLAEYFHDIGNVPKYLTHHGVESFMIKRRVQNEPNVLKKFYLVIEAYKLRKYEQFHCPKFHLNITVSEDDKSLLGNISPESRIEVVENGVDVDFFLPQRAHINTNRLIFAGRLDQYSNMDAVLYFCLRVWPLVKEKFPEMRFTIIGNNPPPKLLEIADYDKGIELLGYVDDVRPYFADATISVCPIRDGGGTRIKILDAMAMGMPIVSTAIGCEGLKVTPEKDVLIANTPRDFVDKIEKLSSDDKLRKSMSSFARKTAEEKYSWKIVGNKLSSLYVPST